jgi:hypothetical protein
VTLRARAAGGAGLVVALVCVAVPFFTATTFFGDDHLFLAFARHEHHPWRAFVADLHGGEYYRPLWMLLWWLLAHAGGAAVFAAAALLLHAGACLLVWALLRSLGRPAPVAAGAAALMFLSPQNLAAASWFSATTDLLATVFVLVALVAVARGRTVACLLATAAACLSKESAYALPALSAIVIWAERSGPRASDLRVGSGAVPEAGSRRPAFLCHRRAVATVGAQAAVVLAVAGVRRAVLHGWGGTGEPGPGVLALVVQIAAGLAKTFTGDEVVPLPVALVAGTAVLGISFWSAARHRGAGRFAAGFAPLALAAAAALPLLGAGSAVGARYDYLPSVGLCWAVAEALAEAGTAARVTIAGGLLLIGVAQGAVRRQDVVSYDGRLAAARRAVRAGVGSGHQVFHIDGGIKDLDLAIKEDPALERAGLLVLGDVPASFAIVPPALEGAALPLLAVPPIPPRGAYRFGDVRVVGLARRGDEPDLSEVLAWFPDLRFIRLMRAPGGQAVARDVTARIEQRIAGEGALDGEGGSGQD